MAFGARDGDRRSLGDLVASIMADISSLIRGEIALAKAEMRASAQQAARGAGLLVVAVVLVSVSGLFLLIAAAFGIAAAGLPVWAGFLIVALVMLLTAGVLAILGKQRFDKVKGPERAKEQRDATRRVLSSVPQRFKDASEKAAQQR